MMWLLLACVPVCDTVTGNGPALARVTPTAPEAAALVFQLEVDAVERPEKARLGVHLSNSSSELDCMVAFWRAEEPPDLTLLPVLDPAVDPPAVVAGLGELTHVLLLSRAWTEEPETQSWPVPMEAYKRREMWVTVQSCAEGGLSVEVVPMVQWCTIGFTEADAQEAVLLEEVLVEEG